MAEPNFKNRTLYHGDNLEFLRGMNSETVHLIATDPPFNKNRDFHATPDSLASGARFKDRWSWDKDVHEEWTDSIQDDWPAVWEVIGTARATYGDDMGAFLCWLGVRLLEMQRVLREDGSIYLHIDHTAHAYVKCVMDAIFGAKNFRNEIVWCYRGMPSKAKRWQQKHDIILFYTKSDSFTFHVLRGEPTAGSMRTFESGRKRGYNANNSKRMVTVFDWDKYRQAVRDGKIPADLQPVEFKGGRPPLRDWWDDIKILGGPKNKERYGFPTQKPLALYRRIITASSNEGDFVLDPFCGCATTPVAAEQLNRRWVGMDIWDGANEAVTTRLRDEWLLTTEEAAGMMFPHIVHYETETPSRTDDDEVASPLLRLKIQRAIEPWEKISHRGMMNILVEAQGTIAGVICAGCGRVLEREFMQLDHITPKSDRGANHILNRILLCGPCNRRKRDNLTLRGLLRENKKKAVGWMKDESMAKMAQDLALDKAEWARDYFDTQECQDLIRG
ncbi:MAG: hypothetical protein F4136_13085 [Chloroflexi bacterium]|nr:hypothetical protein [Chloroflexota bacterium]